MSGDTLFTSKAPLAERIAFAAAAICLCVGALAWATLPALRNLRVDSRVYEIMLVASIVAAFAPAYDATTAKRVGLVLAAVVAEAASHFVLRLSPAVDPFVIIGCLQFVALANSGLDVDMMTPEAGGSGRPWGSPRQRLTLGMSGIGLAAVGFVALVNGILRPPICESLADIGVLFWIATAYRASLRSRLLLLATGSALVIAVAFTPTYVWEELIVVTLVAAFVMDRNARSR